MLMYVMMAFLYHIFLFIAQRWTLVTPNESYVVWFVVVGERSVAKEYLPIKFKNKKSLILKLYSPTLVE
jgi:hypothetical protein